MSPLAVRRPRQGRRRTQGPLKDARLAAAALTLVNASASDADIVAACVEIARSLERVSSADARAASTALLPDLSARFEEALVRGVAHSDSSVAVAEAVCRAMAALSDHADTATLSRLVISRVPEQLVELLRLSSCGAPAAALTSASWLLSNVAADEEGAAAFIAAGGATLLVTIISNAQEEEVVPGDSSLPTGIDTLLLHACVAAACISVHAGGAAALLQAGAIPVLARCLPPSPPPPQAASDGTSSSGPSPERPLSLADAEAACRALAGVLRHCSSAVGVLERDVAQVCSELLTCGAVAACTAALSRAAASPHDPLPVEYAACAAETLLAIVTCATASDSGFEVAETVVASVPSPSAVGRGVGPSIPSLSAAALRQQAAAASTEVTVLSLLGALEAAATDPAQSDVDVGRIGFKGEKGAAALRRTLENATGAAAAVAQTPRRPHP